jgi:N-methylhydantoinase A
VVDLAMATRTKDVSIQRGYDPRELPLVVAGGAGAVHAGAIADELGMSTVIVPRLSSVLCAVGMLLADLRHDYSRSFPRAWDSLDAAEARGVLDGLVEQGTAALVREGVPPERRSVVAAADIRYVGQHHEVTVAFPLDDLAEPSRIEQAFHRRHEELYGFASPGKPMHVIALHATVLGRRDALELTMPAAAGGALPRRASRRMYIRSTGALEEVEVLDGDRMGAGQGIAGPALVDMATTTIVVPETFDVVFDPSGSFVLTRRSGA